MSTAPLFIAYAGTSMSPTLVEPELLELMPLGETPVRAGDVVLFFHSGKHVNLVHRVQRVTAAGFVTRGDSSAQADDGLCLPADIRGRVVAAWRGQRRRAVLGGRLGQLWAWSLAGQHLLLVVGVRLLSGPYHALARSGWLRSFVPAGLRPRVLAFQKEGIQQFRLVVGRRVVGEYDSARQSWRIQPPFLLFTDEASLPPKRL